MEGINNILKNHWIQFVGLIFMAGSFYARFLLLEKEFEDQEKIYNEKIETLHRRITNSNDDLKEFEKRIRDLEKCK